MNPKIAIITDWLTNYGGAESVISAFHDLFPDAPICPELEDIASSRDSSVTTLLAMMTLLSPKPELPSGSSRRSLIQSW